MLLRRHSHSSSSLPISPSQHLVTWKYDPAGSREISGNVACSVAQLQSFRERTLAAFHFGSNASNAICYPEKTKKRVIFFVYRKQPFLLPFSLSLNRKNTSMHIHIWVCADEGWIDR